MLENAKVLISLEDLDDLRLKEKEYLQMVREISNCVEFDFDEYKDELKKIKHDDKYAYIDNLDTDEEIDREIMEAEKHARSLAKILVDTKMLEKILLNNCDLNKTENEIALFETLVDPKIIYIP
jgi:hypothetical protein